MSHAPTRTVDRRRLWVWPLVAVAAAACLLWLSPSGLLPAVQPPAPQASLPSTPQVREPIFASVTFAANEVALEDADGARKLSGREAIGEGALLRTGPHGLVHIRLWDGTGFALAPNSELHFRWLRRAQAELRLQRGHVYNRVASLDEGDRYLVALEDYEAHVHGTAFGVSHAGVLAVVRVDEGRVELRHDGEHVRMIEEGQRWLSASDTEPPVDDFVGSDDRRVRGLTAETASWPLLQLPPMPRVRAWLPMGRSIEASGPLRMRQPPGPGSLSLRTADGRMQTLDFELGAQGLALTEREILDALKTPPDARWGELAPEQIRPVVQRGLPDLRRCYEHTQRRDHTTKGSATLQIRVSAAGTVAHARVEAPELPKELRRCVKQRVLRWVFPAPEGGPVQLELPVNLRRRQR